MRLQENQPGLLYPILKHYTDIDKRFYNCKIGGQTGLNRAQAAGIVQNYHLTRGGADIPTNKDIYFYGLSIVCTAQTTQGTGGVSFFVETSEANQYIGATPYRSSPLFVAAAGQGLPFRENAVYFIPGNFILPAGWELYYSIMCTHIFDVTCNINTLYTELNQ